MKTETNIPKFVSAVVIFLGSADVLRGVLHTIRLEHSAINIAGLDLATAQGADLLQIMGAFGISNYLTGIMLILIGWKMRPFALTMLGIIPAMYLVGVLSIRFYQAPYAESQAAWGGAGPMRIYLILSLMTFLIGITLTWVRSNTSQIGSMSVWPFGLKGVRK